MNRKKATLAAIAVAAVGVSLGGGVVGAATPPLQTFSSTDQFTTQVLTPDHADSYSLNYSTDSLGNGTESMAANPGNVSGNLREAFWPSNEQPMTNSEVCATWSSASTNALQEGLALHIVNNNGVTTAITVTKNVIYGIYWVFNVHTWNTSQTPYPFTQIAQFSFPKVVTYLGVVLKLPWRACAQIQNGILDFKIWRPNVMSEPAWGDPNYTASVAVPAAYTGAGLTGWYIGHIPPGGNATYTQLGVWDEDQ